MDSQTVTAVMNDPLAQELLSSNIPARMAYTGLDGQPRAIPIGFYWNGSTLVLSTDPSTYKVKALRANPRVALTIDTNGFPPHVLLMRGEAKVEIVDGVPAEYIEGGRKYLPAEGFDAWLAEVKRTYKQMARIEVRLDWAKILDFETRVPSFLERLMREQESSV